ncbi:MAG: DUF120 domain-containing protein [Candidatus Aenigmatarchaeota archaeon]
MEIRGIVVSGAREGEIYVPRYNKIFLEKLGFEAFPGTLNIRVEEKPVLENEIKIIPDKGFKLKCFNISIHDNKGAIIVPEETKHSENILEIVSPINLREKLNLKDGDEVICQKLD